VKLLGGPDHPAIGFAVGMERVVSLLDEEGEREVKRPDFFIVALGEKAEKSCFDWTMALRKKGMWVETDYGSKSLKAQMKKADRLGAKKTLIVGEDEFATGKGLLRGMKTGEQEEVDLQNIVTNLLNLKAIR